MTQVFIIAGTSWTVPADWNSADNSIETIGAGGGGSNADINFDNLECIVEFSEELNAFAIYVSQGFYSTSDSKRFETKTEEKEEGRKKREQMKPLFSPAFTADSSSRSRCCQIDPG